MIMILILISNCHHRAASAFVKNETDVTTDESKNVTPYYETEYSSHSSHSSHIFETRIQSAAHTDTETLETFIVLLVFTNCSIICATPAT